MKRGAVVGVGLCAASIAVAAAFSREHSAEPATPALAASPVTVQPPPVPTGPALDNRAAYIPPQCYARTHRDGKPARNPCATCHQESRAPNFVDDADVQTELSMPRYATTNRWTNALHPPAAVEIDDAALLAYVRADNYASAGGAGRALALDRAYMGVVRDQSFIDGRDVVLGAAQIESQLVQDSSTGVTEPIAPAWKR